MERKNVLTISQEVQKSKLPGLEGLYGGGLQEKMKAEIDELPQTENLSIPIHKNLCGRSRNKRPLPYL